VEIDEVLADVQEHAGTKAASIVDAVRRDLAREFDE